MKYTGTTYRPPYEADSLLVQVTQGCSNNRCAFCTMYKDISFAVESLEQIEHDLREARRFNPVVKRIFLLNGDAFSLGYEKLSAIGKKVIEIFPEVETIATYASILAIAHKSDEELKSLRELRFNGMNIGLESGHTKTLGLLRKGYTAETAKTQLLRLKSFGYEFCLNIIVGGGGTQYSKEHALESVKLLNAVQPWMIFIMTLFLTKGTALYDKAQSGEFIENTAGENLNEELNLIKALELDDTIVLGMHPSNSVSIAGIFPKEKERLLLALEKGIKEQRKDFLTSRPKRGTEGRYIG